MYRNYKQITVAGLEHSLAVEMLNKMRAAAIEAEQELSIEWKLVYRVGNVNYHGRYAVSNMGNVVDLTNLNFLSQSTSPQGYNYVTLSYGEHSKKVRTHKLVMLVFTGYDGEIDHIDGNKQNNFITNLCPVTHHENVARSLIDGRKGMNRVMRKSDGKVWRSVAACAEELGHIKQWLHYRLEKGNGIATIDGEDYILLKGKEN